jgi:hypothetical protein
MLTRRLSRVLAIGVIVVAIGGGAYAIVSASAVGTGRGRHIRHGQQHLDVELHGVDTSG